MSSVYTTEAAIDAMIQGDGGRLTTILDLDEDGDADAGVLTQAIADSGAEINSRLAQRWPVPFDDTPDTPEIIELIARHLTVAALYDRWEPDGRDSKRHAAKANSLLEKLLSGDFTIPGVDPLEGDEGRTAITYSADEPQFSGRDADGNRRWRGM